MSYFRRSRNGCQTCKTRRVKCDEREPSCSQCEEKETPCEGYMQRLKWAQEKLPKDGKRRKSLHREEAIEQQQINSSKSSSTALVPTPRRRKPQSPSLAATKPQHYTTLHSTIALNPYGFYIKNQLDRNLMEYNLSILPDLVFLNKSRSAILNAMRFLGTMEDKTVLYSSALASAASHLFARGAITSLEFYQKRQLALKSLRLAIAAPTHDVSKTLPPSEHVCQASLPARFCDNTIEASLTLAGMELMQGASLKCIYPFLHGTTILVKERHEYADRLNFEYRDLAKLDSPLFILSKRMLAYFDVLSCVPCARRPLLDEKYWLTDEACIREENVDGSGLDPVLGCFSAVIALLGKSAALVCTFFETSSEMDQFRSAQESLLQDLASWKPIMPQLSSRARDFLNTKPFKTLDNESNLEKDKEYLFCLSAGNAHSLATQIFLRRATDFDQYSAVIQALVSSLQSAILEVGTLSAPTTTMLWPLWVLGCECYDEESRRRTVIPFIEEMLNRQGFLNISQCFNVLQECIWKISFDTNYCEGDSSVSGSLKTNTSWQQSRWVRYCWAKKVELILA